jgi:glutathione synthase/RimK-type ligase-like ATP-grasp enzyme
MAASAPSAVLLLTERSDLAADLLVLALEQLNASFFRINLDEFPMSLSASWRPLSPLEIVSDGLCIDARRIKSAWYRREPRPVLPRDPSTVPNAGYISAETSAFLAGCWATADWFWVNRPSSVTGAENKLAQLRSAKHLGLEIPDTLVSNCPTDIKQFAAQYQSVAVKTLVSRTIETDQGRFGFFTRRFEDLSEKDPSSLQIAPCIFQEAVEKSADLRVTVIGSSVFATKIVTTQGDKEIDWRAVDPTYLVYESYDLPRSLKDSCLRLVKDFGLSFAALDFLLVPDGKHIFLELNPSGQWGWLERSTGQPLTHTLASLLMRGA